ncbi:uncharacterized protein LOC108002670 isoform X3 [Apis cerana]|uniref:uncharacterized protein LOC108002670 isoform X3 n=1 Tax=Apis cerana TaxID=7461 RepID=UPI002B234081|nr:uncharacterized protein LOC108002670 isoform X3 [Apis cerana]
MHECAKDRHIFRKILSHRVPAVSLRQRRTAASKQRDFNNFSSRPSTDITASKQLVVHKNLHTWMSYSTFSIPDTITITDTTNIQTLILLKRGTKIHDKSTSFHPYEASNVISWVVIKFGKRDSRKEKRTRNCCFFQAENHRSA